MLSFAYGKISSVLTDKNRECRTCSEMIVNCARSTKRISEEFSTYSFHRFKCIKQMNNLSILFHEFYKFAEVRPQMR